MNTQKFRKPSSPTADMQKVLFRSLHQNQSRQKQSNQCGGEETSEESLDASKNVFMGRSCVGHKSAM